MSKAYDAYDALSTTALYPTLAIDDLLSIIGLIHHDISTRAEWLKAAEAVHTCGMCASTNVAVFDDSQRVNDLGMLIAIEIADVEYIRKCRDCDHVLHKWRD